MISYIISYMSQMITNPITQIVPLRSFYSAFWLGTRWHTYITMPWMRWVSYSFQNNGFILDQDFPNTYSHLSYQMSRWCPRRFQRHCIEPIVLYWRKLHPYGDWLAIEHKQIFVQRHIYENHSPQLYHNRQLKVSNAMCQVVTVDIKIQAMRLLSKRRPLGRHMGT